MSAEFNDVGRKIDDALLTGLRAHFAGFLADRATGPQLGNDAGAFFRVRPDSESAQTLADQPFAALAAAFTKSVIDFKDVAIVAGTEEHGVGAGAQHLHERGFRGAFGLRT